MKVTCAIILVNKDFLITQRPLHKKQGGKWEFPGGKIDVNEPAEDCIKREILEELSIEIKIIELLTPIIHKYETIDIELIPYICEISSGKIVLNEHLDYKWVNFDTVKNFNLCDADKKVIPQLKKYF